MAGDLEIGRWPEATAHVNGDREQCKRDMGTAREFNFAHPDMDTTIVGTVNPAHIEANLVEANLAALRNGPLPPALYAEAKRRLAATGLAPQALSSEPRQ